MESMVLFRPDQMGIPNRQHCIDFYTAGETSVGSSRGGRLPNPISAPHGWYLATQLRTGGVRRSGSLLGIRFIRIQVLDFGFVPEGSDGISKLRLARREGGALVYVGRVGTGWDRETARAIRRALEPLALAASPLSTPLKKADRGGLSRSLMLRSLTRK